MPLPLNPPLARGAALRGEVFCLAKIGSSDAYATEGYPPPGRGTKGVEKASAVVLFSCVAMMTTTIPEL